MIDGHPWQRRHRGPRRDNDILRAHLLASDLNRVRRHKCRKTFQPINFVLLEQEFNPGGQPLNRLQALAVHGIQIEFDLVDLHPKLRQRARRRLGKQRRGIEQRLRRDTPDIETGAAQRRAALRTGRLQPQLRRPNRRNIAAGAGPDDEDVIVEIRHYCLRCLTEVDVGSDGPRQQ